MAAVDREIAGRRFRTYFAAVCVTIREDAGASLERVADRIGVGSYSVRRFEQGLHFPGENLEHYAAGYASLPRPPIDPRDIFLRAVRWWQQAGLPPVWEEDGSPEPTPREILAARTSADRTDAQLTTPGERLKELRKARRISQRDMAIAAGVTSRRYQAWEREEEEIPPAKLNAMLERLRPTTFDSTEEDAARR